MPTELDVAEAIADGTLPSPQPAGRSWLFALRVSGTGAALRPILDEIAWREPSVWLNARMARRWLGAPVLLGHPSAGVLDGNARPQIIGTIVHAYVNGTELWAIARIFSAHDADRLADPDGYTVDTSPAVGFALGTVSTIEFEDGDPLTVEGEPSFIDHLAIVLAEPGQAGGVWSRGSVTSVGIDSGELENA